MAGLDVPVVPLLHAYVVSSPMQSITRTLPNVKDSDGRVYFRVKGDSLCVGGFEYNPIFLDQVMTFIYCYIKLTEEYLIAVYYII